MAARRPGGWLSTALLAGVAVSGVLAASAEGVLALAAAGLAVTALVAALVVSIVSRSGGASPREAVRPNDVGLAGAVGGDRAAALAWHSRAVAGPSADRLGSALELLRTAVGGQSAILLVPDDEAVETLRVAASVPSSDSSLRRDAFPASVGLPGATLREDRLCAAVVGDRVDRTCPYALKSRVVAHAMAQPLPSDGGGVLVVERATDVPFGPAEAATLAQTAGLVGWLCESEDVFSRALERVAALESVADAAHALATADDATDVSLRAIEAAATLVPVDAAVVALLDDGGARFRVVGTSGCDVPVDATFPADAGLAGRTRALRETLPARGRQPDGGGRPFGDTIAWEPPPGGALAIVPLVGGDEVIGVLLVCATAPPPQGPPPYDRGQRILLRTLANLAGAELVRRRLERSLAALARTDPLTGLANRRAFDEALAGAVARSVRYGHATSLVLIDLDHFKRVNDEHGHATGDLVLQGTARAMLGLARGVDVAARVGGEEMAVLLEHTDTAGATHVAGRLRETIARLPFPSSDGTFHVTASFGVATLGVHARNGEALIAAADDALYAAKHGGRNRVEVARGV